MVTVRLARPADAAAVVRIRVRAWQQAYAGIMPQDVLDALDGRIEDEIQRTRQRWESGRPLPFTTVVAEPTPGLVTGFATYGPYRLVPSGEQVDHRAGEVVLIYVDPRHQRAGAGRALMDAAVAALREAGAGEVRLWVLEQNASARRFYQRYGFVADGQRHVFPVTRPNGERVDLPELRYTLSCAATSMKLR